MTKLKAIEQAAREVVKAWNTVKVRTRDLGGKVELDESPEEKRLHGSIFTLQRALDQPPKGKKTEGRWQVLKETSPSGKTLFRCLVCLRTSPTPDKRCPTMDCEGIEERLFNAPRELRFDPDDPQICQTCDHSGTATFEEPCSECLKQDGRGFHKWERKKRVSTGPVDCSFCGLPPNKLKDGKFQCGTNGCSMAVLTLEEWNSLHG